jgi:hypothetical protein
MTTRPDYTPCWIFIAYAVAVLALLAAFLCGCDSPYAAPITSLPQVGEGLALCGADAQDAAGHVERAKPHADDIGKTELGGATVSLNDLELELAKARVAFDASTQQVSKLARNYSDKARELEAERDHWLGFKTRQLLFWVILVGGLTWLGLGIGGMALKGFGAGWVFTIGQQILRALPGANFFSAGANKILEARGQAAGPVAAPVTVNFTVSK